MTKQNLNPVDRFEKMYKNEVSFSHAKKWERGVGKEWKFNFELQTLKVLP